MVFAEIAEQLYDADSLDDVLLRIAEAAVSTIAGCRMASVTSVSGVVPNRRLHRSGRDGGGSSAVPVARGPCLDAVDAPMVYAQSFPDERWPTLASRPTESGVQSALSYRLAAASSATADSGGGSELLRRHSVCVQRHCAGDWTYLGRARLGGGPGG